MCLTEWERKRGEEASSIAERGEEEEHTGKENEMERRKE